jgi:hypothetical protein
MFVKMNFIPFKHFVLSDDSDCTRKVVDGSKTLYFKEVGRSHTNKKGEFSLTSGAVTNKLATMYLLLVEKYASKSNWRGYSYVDEMQGAALLHSNGRWIAYGHAWVQTLEAGRWIVRDSALAAAPVPVYYVPSFVMADEGPGYQLGMMLGLGRLPSRIEILDHGAGALPR